MTATTRLRTTAYAVAVSATLVAGCSSADDGSSGETTTSAVHGEPTTAADGAPEFGPLALFTIDWNAKNAIGENTVDGFVSSPLEASAFTTAPADEGDEVFMARVNDAAIVGGRIESGSITSVLVAVAPNHPAAASTLQTAILRHLDDESDLIAIAEVYRDVATASELTSRFMTVGTDDSFVISAVDGGAANDGRLITISTTNLLDETEARARAVADETDVFQLLDSRE